jgi:hypothetical protein
MQRRPALVNPNPRPAPRHRHALRALERSARAARDDHVQIEIAAVSPNIARFLDLADAERELALIDRPPF